MTYQVTLTELAATTAAHKRDRTRATELATTIGRGFEDLYSYTSRHGSIPTGPPQVTYPGEFRSDGEVDVELFLPVDQRTVAQDDIEVVELPGGPVAQTFHHGRYEDIGPAHEALLDWIRAHGRLPAGPPREIYLTGPDAVENPQLYLTEIVIPLTAD